MADANNGVMDVGGGHTQIKIDGKTASVLVKNTDADDLEAFLNPPAPLVPFAKASLF